MGEHGPVVLGPAADRDPVPGVDLDGRKRQPGDLLLAEMAFQRLIGFLRSAAVGDQGHLLDPGEGGEEDRDDGDDDGGGGHDDLTGPGVLKIFHFARFDIAVLEKYLGVAVSPIYCTKIVSKLVRTYTDRHGLKDLVGELLGIELSKQQQSSDWASKDLSQQQLSYAAADVLHLHALKTKLDAMLEREGRRGFAEAAFEFLPTRAKLDLAGFEEDDIFSHCQFFRLVGVARLAPG